MPMHIGFSISTIRRHAVIGALASALMVLAQSAQAQGYKVLYSFRNQSSPEAALLRDRVGNLYGTTTHGGKYGQGTVFKLKATGELIILHKFTGGTDGGEPYAGLIRDKVGNLYGTTYGTVFELNRAWHETVLNNGSTTSFYAGLIMDNAGNLYGAGALGGTDHYGAVFELSLSNGSWTEKLLYSFAGPGDGATPRGTLVMDDSGNLYGTTFGDNGTESLGTVFKLDKTGHETVLHNFDGQDGEKPLAGLIQDKAGNLYGTTSKGGGSNNAGVVFKVNKKGILTVLYSFAGFPSDGDYPAAGLVMDKAGNLYGTTVEGGSSGNGTVFKLDTTNKETVLYSFTGKADGGNPYGGLIMDRAGNLYGTTSRGGDLSCGNHRIGCGVVFKLTP